MSNSSSLFKVLADKFLLASFSPQEEPLEFLKLSYYCKYGNLDAAKKIIAANQMRFELNRFFITHLHKISLKYEAIEIAKESLYSANTAVKGVYILTLEERADRFNRDDLLSTYDFIMWAARFILNTLLELKDYNKAIDYVYNGFTGTKDSENTPLNAGCFEYYNVLERALPVERKGELAKRLFGNLDKLSVYTVRDLCIYENYWLPLLDSFKIKNRLYDVLHIYKDCKDQLIVFPQELSEMFYSVIIKYAEKDSSSKRKEIIKSGLKELSLIKESEPILFSLLLNLKTKFGNRKVLLNLIDEFVLENNIKEEYENYEKENFDYSNENYILNGVGFGNQTWGNSNWILGLKEILQKEPFLHELVKIIDNSGSLSEIPTHIKPLILDSFRNAIFSYIRKSKKKESIKTAKIILALNTFLKLIDYEDQFFELIVTLQIKHPNKIELNKGLVEYIERKGYTDKLAHYRIENAEEVLKNNRASSRALSTVRKPGKLFWNNKEWSENKLRELSSAKSIFEILKYLPDDTEELSDQQKHILFNIYQESILLYASKSKKDEATKTKNIKRALEGIIRHFYQIGSIDKLVSELKIRYPNRLKFIDMLDNFV